MKTIAKVVSITTATAVADDATADYKDIDTGLHHVGDAYQVQVRRAGAIVTADAVCTRRGAGVIRVADGGATYAVTAGDIIIVTAQEGV
jgi:hypothetical protein